MDTPDFPVMKEICEAVKNASFKVKTRGYAPKEVDEFMDQLVDKLMSVDTKLDSIQQYEKWLRVEAHSQVMSQAQQEALRMMQEAQDKSRALLESAHQEIAREKADFQEEMEQYVDAWNEKKDAMEQELQEMRAFMDEYRNTAIQSMEESLCAMKMEQERDVGRQFAHNVTMPSTASQVNSPEDVDRFIEELKKQLKK